MEHMMYILHKDVTEHLVSNPKEMLGHLHLDCRRSHVEHLIRDLLVPVLQVLLLSVLHDQSQHPDVEGLEHVLHRPIFTPEHHAWV